MVNPLTPPTSSAPAVAAPTGLLADRNKRGPSALRKGLNDSPIRTLRSQLADPNLDPKMRGRYEREILRQGGSFAKGYDPQMKGGAVNRYQQQYKQQHMPPPPPPPQQGQQSASGGYTWPGQPWPGFQLPAGVRPMQPPRITPPAGKEGVPSVNSQPLGPGHYQPASGVNPGYGPGQNQGTAMPPMKNAGTLPPVGFQYNRGY